jgi:hypothetical protein
VICGAISQYNNTGPITGPSNYLSLLTNRATMKGMLVMDYADRYAQAGAEMAGWMAAGKLKSREDIVEGLETFPETLLKLFKSENVGKADAESGLERRSLVRRSLFALHWGLRTTKRVTTFSENRKGRTRCHSSKIKEQRFIGTNKARAPHFC